MVRGLLILAGAMAALAPMVCAQGVTVCVFQAPKGHKMHTDHDAEAVATALSALKLPNGDAISAIPIDGVPTEEEGAEAQKRGCGFVAELWRTDIPESTPLFAGTITPGGLGHMSQAEVAMNSMGDAANTVLDYSLAKANSGKKLAHGEQDEAQPWTPVADTLAKRIARAR